MSWILAIDQSTSATKAVLFDAQGNVFDRASREHRQIYPQPGWVEHDAEEIWQNTLAVVDQLRQRQPDVIAQVAGISITNQRETIVVFDRQTSEPLYHAIVWQCRRGGDLCRELCEQGDSDWVRDRTGLKIDTYFSGSKIAWLMRNVPGVADKVLDGRAVFGTIDAYLVHRLTNGLSFVTDHTNASRTLLFDVKRLAWDGDLCRLFGIPTSALPEVKESFQVVGETDAGGRLPKKVPVCGVMGDSQASLMAQRCFEEGMIKATFGTGTSVMMNVGDQFRLPAHGSVLALAWCCNGKPTYALEGLINYSSATIAWLRDQLEILGDAAESEALAHSVGDNDGVYLVPAFAGLGAPYWSPNARAAIVGMTGHTMRGHIVRAALESIAYQIRDCVEMIQLDTNIRPTRLMADGGPTRNAFLMQFTADMLGLPLQASEISESSALGAALAGMIGLEIHHDLSNLAELPRTTRRYDPAPRTDRIDRWYAGWQDAVQRVLM
ncbi:MAG: glycerol kinase GlpK [Pirellulaceae bacterium]|nr:glycerol kinase GlpK [Planctomycetales bacterium]